MADDPAPSQDDRGSLVEFARLVIDAAEAARVIDPDGWMDRRLAEIAAEAGGIAARLEIFGSPSVTDGSG